MFFLNESVGVLGARRRFHAGLDHFGKEVVVAIAGGFQQCKERFVEVQKLYETMRHLYWEDVVPKSDPTAEDGEAQETATLDQFMARWKREDLIPLYSTMREPPASVPGSSDAQSARRVGLNVMARAPISMFHPLSWACSFVELLYGDHLPGNRRRGQRRGNGQFGAKMHFEKIAALTMRPPRPL